MTASQLLVLCMAIAINANLKIPYDIGNYIVSLVAAFSDITSTTAAVHAFFHFDGPNPSVQQMSQGLILEVSTTFHKPQALFTRYGRWEILGPSRGNFLGIFNKCIQEQLHLRKM